MISKWHITATQFLIGNQLIFIVRKRQSTIHQDSSDSIMVDYNDSISDFDILFYGFRVRNNEIFVFQSFSEDKVIKGVLNGRIGLFYSID